MTTYREHRLRHGKLNGCGFGRSDAKLDTCGGHMRDLLLLVGVIAVLAISGAGQDAGDARAAIRKIVDDQQAAWNRQDLDGFMAGYLHFPGVKFFSRPQGAKGWDAAR